MKMKLIFLVILAHQIGSLAPNSPTTIQKFLSGFKSPAKVVDEVQSRIRAKTDEKDGKFGLAENFKFPCPDNNGTTILESFCRFDCRNVTVIDNSDVTVVNECKTEKLCQGDVSNISLGRQFIRRVKRELMEPHKRFKRRIFGKSKTETEDDEEDEEEIELKCKNARFCSHVPKVKKERKKMEICDQSCSYSRTLKCEAGQPRKISAKTVQFHYHL